MRRGRSKFGGKNWNSSKAGTVSSLNYIITHYVHLTFHKIYI